MKFMKSIIYVIYEIYESMIYVIYEIYENYENRHEPANIAKYQIHLKLPIKKKNPKNTSVTSFGVVGS